MKIHNPVRFKFLLLALILLVTFISSQLIKAARTEQYKDWAPAPGSFLKQERLKDFRTRVYYAYTVNGKDYRGSKIYHSSTSSWPDAGAAVAVWYDPEAPARSSYHKPGPGLDPYAPYFLALPICAAILLKSPRSRPAAG